MDVKDLPPKLQLGQFTINKPIEECDDIELEIRSYDYESTKISIDDLKSLHHYIGNILNAYKK